MSTENKFDEHRIKKLFAECIRAWGLDSQQFQLVEETGELLQALSKIRRKKSIEALENFAGEIADVEIMLTQMKQIYLIEKEVEEIKLQKLERLEKRLIEYQNNIDHNTFLATDFTCENCLNGKHDLCTLEEYIPGERVIVKPCKCIVCKEKNYYLREPLFPVNNFDADMIFKINGQNNFGSPAAENKNICDHCKKGECKKCTLSFPKCECDCNNPF